MKPLEALHASQPARSASAVEPAASATSAPPKTERSTPAAGKRASCQQEGQSHKKPVFVQLQHECFSKRSTDPSVNRRRECGGSMKDIERNGGSPE